MEAIKAIISILACIALLAAEALVMGSFSVDRALTGDPVEKMVRETMADTETAGQLVDEVLAENAVDADGYYGDVIKSVLQTNAVTGYFTEYLTSVINAEVYGKPAEEMTEHTLADAFSQGIDELNDSGEYAITDVEAERLIQAVQAEEAALMQKIHQQVSSYEALMAGAEEEGSDEEPGMLDKLHKLMDTKIRLITAGVCILLWTILIALNWRSRFGFLWCGLMTAVVSVLFWGLSFAGAERIATFMLHTSEFPNSVFSVVNEGLADAALYGSVAALVFLIVFAVFKIADRRRI